MRINSVFIFLVLILISCEKEPPTIVNYNEIVLDSLIINKFYNDAKQLYFDELYDNSTHQNNDTSLIYEDQINDILKIFQAVYDSDLPQRDTIFEKYDIHARYCYDFNSISLKVAPDSAEIKNLVSGEIPTGQQHLDSLINTYGFDSVKSAASYPETPWLKLFCSKEYNMIPIKKSFSKIPSVITAKIVKGCGGDGNNIILDRGNNEATITFSIGRGDCWSGCIYHKYWVFQIRGTKPEFVQSWERGE